MRTLRKRGPRLKTGADRILNSRAGTAKRRPGDGLSESVADPPRELLRPQIPEGVYVAEQGVEHS
jgi:hypothetical protein